MAIFFTSDTHFGHSNIIKFCNRPFEDNTEMNQVLIENWNNKVGKNDHIYHLGDFALGSEKMASQILDRLNGKKFLIRGNHEKAVLGKEFTRTKFEWIKDYFELKHQFRDEFKIKIILFHYPIESWNSKPHGTWHLHGHTHNNIDSPDKFRLDVGVDNPITNFAPLHIDEIRTIMDEKLNKQ